MSAKITIIAFNAICNKYNYHQMFKFEEKSSKKLTFILAEHQSSSNIDIFFNFSKVRNFNPVLLNFVYFIKSAPQRSKV